MASLTERFSRRLANIGDRELVDHQSVDKERDENPLGAPGPQALRCGSQTWSTFAEEWAVSRGDGLNLA
jgi:hypothetical protein